MHLLVDDDWLVHSYNEMVHHLFIKFRNKIASKDNKIYLTERIRTFHQAMDWMVSTDDRNCSISRTQRKRQRTIPKIVNKSPTETGIYIPAFSCMDQYIRLPDRADTNRVHSQWTAEETKLAHSRQLALLFSIVPRKISCISLMMHSKLFFLLKLQLLFTLISNILRQIILVCLWF